MRKALLFFAVCLFFNAASFAQSQITGSLKSGDLLFQNLDCGGLCDAIEKVTKSIGDRQLSHMGLVSVEGRDTFIIEAIGTKVQKTNLKQFIARNKNEIIMGRVKNEYAAMVPQAVAFCKKQIGVSYDQAFLYNNKKYYCSELVYDAFKTANSGNPFFELQPMTFRDSQTEDYFPVWVTYFEKLKMDIPEAKPGINPGGISTSDKLDIFVYRK